MPRDILELAAPPADERLAYGAGEHHFGDLRLPRAAGPHPAIVYIHGGFWRSKFSLDHAGHLCEALRHAGVATWSIEYRRVGDVGGGWPGTLDDVLAGVRMLETIAGPRGIDLTRVAVAGHSAGGQLALWVAAQDAIALRSAISLGGVIDLRRGFELRLGNGAIEEFLGGAPAAVDERYRSASPMELLPMATRQVLIHGTRDDVVPIELSERFAAASKNCRVLRLEGADHFDVIDPRSVFWPEVETALVAGRAECN